MSSIKRMTFIILLISLAVVHALPQQPNPVVTENFVKIFNKFTQDFWLEAGKTQADNFVFSPLSLHAALAVITSGATPESQTFYDLLDGNDNDLATLESSYGDILKAYNEVKEHVIFANRFWSAEGYSQRIEEPFRKLLKEIYRSELVDLGPNPTKEVNDWVKETTKGKIDK